MDKQNMKELQLLYEAEMTDQSAFARGRRALFGDDYERARQCFQKAVSEGHAEAMTFLGYMYRKGLGVHRDDAKAAVLYRQAINTGGDTLLTSVAYNNLGVLFKPSALTAQKIPNVI